jgi:hypothetical protein
MFRSGLGRRLDNRHTARLGLALEDKTCDASTRAAKKFSAVRATNLEDLVLKARYVQGRSRELSWRRRAVYHRRLSGNGGRKHQSIHRRFEPGLTESESAVLPNCDPSISDDSGCKSGIP